MGYLFWICIVLTVAWIRTVDEQENFLEKIFVSIVYVSILISVNY